MNISKKPWNFYTLVNKRGKNIKIDDMFYVFKLDKVMVSNLLNTWFPSNNVPSKYICLKKVDKESTLHLYGNKYNPVTVYFYNSNYGECTTNLIASIRSVDDASYTVELQFDKDKSDSDIRNVAKEIMTYVSNKKKLNGREFMEFCKNYNDKYYESYD